MSLSGDVAEPSAHDVVPPQALPGLRERKKRRTREAIARAALELFAEHGFRATTIAMVAAAADVSPRTVSAYFPAKEELVFPHMGSAIGGLERRLRARRPGETATEALRAWITEMLDAFADEAGHANELTRLRVIEQDAGLRAWERHQLERAEHAMAVAVAEDWRTTPDELGPQLAGAAAIAVLTALARFHKDLERPADVVARRGEALALVDQAIAFVRAGIRGLERERADATR